MREEGDPADFVGLSLRLIQHLLFTFFCLEYDFRISQILVPVVRVELLGQVVEFKVCFFDGDGLTLSILFDQRRFLKDELLL